MINTFLKNITELFERHEKLYIFLFVLFIYTINVRPIPSGDTFPAAILPFSILDGHHLYLDKFSDTFSDDTFNYYFVAEKAGHYLSTYPIVIPILITPLYFIPYVLLKILHYPISTLDPAFSTSVFLMEKLSASIIVSLSSIFIFLSLKRLTNKRVAYIGTMIYAFATTTWAISSQALWQHGMAELLLSILIYVVIKNKKDFKNYIFLGIVSGLFIMNRPPDIVLLLPISLYVLLNSKRFFIFCYSFSAILSALPFVIYNIYYFGNVFGGYGDTLNYFFIGREIFMNFAGLLISPSRGLLIYSPIFVFSLLGFFSLSNIENKKLRMCFYFFGISIFLNIVLYSAWKIWWGGWSFGPRLLTDMTPILILFISLYVYQELKKKKKNLVFAGLFSILIVISIFVQIVGAFYYPNGSWNEVLIEHPEKLWDWNDTQIKRSFFAGPML